MKRNYILFQILLIIAGLTFYSCSVPKIRNYHPIHD